MKRAYIFFIIGSGFLVPGLILLGYVTSTVDEKFQLTGIAMEGTILEPGQIHSVMISLYSEEEVYLMVSSAPRHVPLIAKISEMNGTTVYEVAFDSQHIAPIPEIRDGDYVISLTNVGDERVIVNVLVSADPVADQLDIVMNITFVMIAGILLILIGIIVLIVGAIFLIVDKKRARTTKT